MLVCYAILSFLFSTIVELQVACRERIGPFVLQNLILRLSDHLVLGEVIVPAVPCAVDGSPLVVKLLLATQEHLLLLFEIVQMVILIVHLLDVCVSLVSVDLALDSLKILLPAPRFDTILDHSPLGSLSLTSSLVLPRLVIRQLLLLLLLGPLVVCCS